MEAANPTPEFANNPVVVAPKNEIVDVAPLPEIDSTGPPPAAVEVAIE